LRSLGKNRIEISWGRAEPAISVHVYTPGLSWMHTYRIDGAALVRTGTERAGVDW